MKLLGSTKIKITKGGNGENVPPLEITEVILNHCNIVNNDYQHNCIYTVLICRYFLLIWHNPSSINSSLIKEIPKDVYLLKKDSKLLMILRLI